MTIQQLQYVLEIARCGSASRAAKNLFMSQPNLSSAVKNLEAELGMTLFERTSSGMRLTASGRLLADKATMIMEHLKEISDSTADTSRFCSFRLVYPMYYPAFEAFMDLCMEYQDYDKIHLSCATGSGEKQLEHLYRGTCDLVVFVDSQGHFTDFYRYCDLFQLEYVELALAAFSVQLSRNHPLLMETPFDFSKLKEYPYVAFSDGGEGNLNWTPWSSVVNPEKLIKVQSTMARLALVEKTNAFSLVLPHSEVFNESNGVVTIPLPFRPLSVGYIYSKERGLGECGQAYVRHLEKRLHFHIGE